MALIKCPECGSERISDSAKACPVCGFDIYTYRKKQNRQQAMENNGKTLKSILVILLSMFLVYAVTSCNQKEKYASFSGEYRAVSGKDEGLPNVITFNHNGKGHYYVNSHMYIFEYKLSRGVLVIQTHEELSPIYKGEIDAQCRLVDGTFTILDTTYKKR